MGLFAAVMHNLYDAFRNTIPEGNPFVHVVSGVVIYVLTGALGLGLISTIRNWLMQDR